MGVILQPNVEFQAGGPPLSGSDWWGRYETDQGCAFGRPPLGAGRLNLQTPMRWQWHMFVPDATPTVSMHHLSSDILFQCIYGQNHSPVSGNAPRAFTTKH